MSLHTKDELLEFFTRHNSDIKTFRVNKLGLFGSYVRNEQTHESDIDLLVEYEDGCKTLDNFLGLIDYLEKNLGRTVELVTPESVSKYIKPYIDKEVEYVDII